MTVTRAQAIRSAAAIYLDEKIRIETEKAIAVAQSSAGEVAVRVERPNAPRTAATAAVAS